MFAPRIAKLRAKSTASSKNGLTRRSLTLVAHRPLAQWTSKLLGNDPAGHSSRQADTASLAAREATPGISWDFSKIPVFPPDLRSGHRPPSRLATTPSPGAVHGKPTVGHAGDPLEYEADRVADFVADTVVPSSAVESASWGNAGSGEKLASPLRGRLEAFLGWDLGDVRIHADEAAGREARARGARAFTRGSDVFFSPGSFRPETRAGVGLLGHELAHARQQSVGRVAQGTVQAKEDWDFTPADYKTLQAGKKDLRFGQDSAWFPSALQDNLLATLKFALTSTKPARTAGINVRDFYHGHFVIPKKAMTSDLSTKRSDFGTKSEELQGKALGGHSFDDVTKANLAAYTKAMQATEKLATPLLEAALKIKGAAVIYHTYEASGPSMKEGSPIRNIRTLIGGSPAGYDPSGTEESANQYLDEYTEILQFAFLVDETGVIHVTTGTTKNLSRVTGTPMQ
jgi:uncharacterized protein DUF4157